MAFDFLKPSGMQSAGGALSNGAQQVGNGAVNQMGENSSSGSLNGMDSGISSADLGSLNSSLSTNLASQGAETNALTNFQEKSSLMQQMGKARGKAIENGAML